MSRTYLRGDMYYADLGRGLWSTGQCILSTAAYQGFVSAPSKRWRAAQGQRIAELNANSSTPPVVSDDKEKRTYSIEEIQQILDISRSTAYLLIKTGQCILSTVAYQGFVSAPSKRRRAAQGRTLR